MRTQLENRRLRQDAVNAGRGRRPDHQVDSRAEHQRSSARYKALREDIGHKQSWQPPKACPARPSVQTKRPSRPRGRDGPTRSARPGCLSRRIVSRHRRLPCRIWRWFLPPLDSRGHGLQLGLRGFVLAGTQGTDNHQQSDTKQRFHDRTRLNCADEPCQVHRGKKRERSPHLAGFCACQPLRKLTTSWRPTQLLDEQPL